MICERCGGRPNHTTVIYSEQYGLSEVVTTCKACLGTGVMADADGRGFVSREATTWCISGTLERGQKIDGIILGKAHRIFTKQDSFGRVFHVPQCGAPMAHLPGACVPAPEGWPQCKRCRKKAGEKVPPAFLVAFGE